MRQTRPLLRVNGEWVHGVAHVGEVEVTDRADGGNWSVSWQMNLPTGQMPPWLTPNAPVQLYAGSLRWSGYLADPDWDAGTFTADGWCRQAETVAALDLSGATNDIDNAIFFAGSGRGAINFSGLSPIGTVGDPPTEVSSIGALLDQKALETGKRWRVDENRILSLVADPTVPSLWVPPGVVDLSASTSTQATHIIAEYRVKSTLALARVEQGVDPRTHERLISLESMGPMDATRAQTIVDQLFARAGGGIPAFTSGFEVGPGQVVNEGGQAVDLSRVRPGRMIRIQGCEDPRTGRPWTDMVIGETVWRPIEQRVQVNPVNLDAADFTGIVEELGGSVLF